MTPEESKELQEKILEICHAAGRLGIPGKRMQHALENATYLKRALIEEGHGTDNAHLDRALKFLESEGLIESEREELRPDLLRWKTTSDGDKYLMKIGRI